MKRRVYDRYGRSGLCILETKYATWANPEMADVVILYLLRSALAKLLIIVGLLLLGLKTDGFLSISYTRAMLPIALVCIGRIGLDVYVLRCCFAHALFSPGYADLHLKGVPGHPRYPTRLGFVFGHVVDIIHGLLLLCFLVVFGLKLDGIINETFTVVCIPLYPFIIGRNFFHVLQLMLVVIKFDGLALQDANWQELLCLVYLVNVWRLLTVLWQGYKSGKKDHEVMQYFQDYHRAAVRMKLVLWAIIPFRSWLLYNLTLCLFTTWLVLKNPFPFLLALSPVILMLVQDVIFPGIVLPIYLLYLRGNTPSPSTEKVVFSPPTHPDSEFLQYSLYKLTQ
ncbi:U2-type spliceosomal complex subunit cwc23, variant 2 [Entomophthora muscae]|nr:U2-type spliceosomal complex subunit cwc23, variant 2 [Entomophthora muscae]